MAARPDQGKRTHALLVAGLRGRLRPAPRRAGRRWPRAWPRCQRPRLARPRPALPASPVGSAAASAGMKWPGRTCIRRSSVSAPAAQVEVGHRRARGRRRSGRDRPASAPSRRRRPLRRAALPAHRVEPGPAVGVGQRLAARHLGDVGRRMQARRRRRSAPRSAARRARRSGSCRRPRRPSRRSGRRGRSQRDRDAAVDEERGAVDEGRRVGGEEDAGADQLLDLAPAAGRGALFQPGGEVRIGDQRRRSAASRNSPARWRCIAARDFAQSVAMPLVRFADRALGRRVGRDRRAGRARSGRWRC